jgi:hypothetical protein
VLKLRCNKSSASTEGPTPPLVEEEASFLNTHMSRREKIWVIDLEETEARNDCAGEDPQQSNRPTDQPASQVSQSGVGS